MFKIIQKIKNPFCDNLQLILNQFLLFILSLTNCDEKLENIKALFWFAFFFNSHQNLVANSYIVSQATVSIELALATYFGVEYCNIVEIKLASGLLVFTSKPGNG
jgi:hypothetical protein